MILKDNLKNVKLDHKINELCQIKKNIYLQ